MVDSKIIPRFIPTTARTDHPGPNRPDAKPHVRGLRQTAPDAPATPARSLQQCARSKSRTLSTQVGPLQRTRGRSVLTGPEGDDLPFAHNYDCVPLCTMFVEVASNRHLHRLLPRKVTCQDVWVDRRDVDCLCLTHVSSLPSFGLGVTPGGFWSLTNAASSRTCSVLRSPLAISTGPPASLS